MRAVANCTVSILRGTETNAEDDEVDLEVPIYAGVRASIVQQSRRVYLPAEGASRIVRSYAGRVGAEVDVQKSDRLRRESDGVVFLVVDIGDPLSPVMTPDIQLSLSRTT